MGVYRVDAMKITGGPGRLVVAPYSAVPFPQRIEDVMDIANGYVLKPPWRDLGATVEGIKINRGYETEEFEVDQVVGPIELEISKWTHTIETQLAQPTVENRQLALVGGAITEEQETHGTAVQLSEDVMANQNKIKLSDVSGIKPESFVIVGSMTQQPEPPQNPDQPQTTEDGQTATTYEKVQVVKVDEANKIIYLRRALTKAFKAGDLVTPITQVATQRIGFGTEYNLPSWTLALISQKKDGTLVMVVFYRVQVDGDEKEFEFSKSKRLIPLKMQALPEGSVDYSENIYYEIEQVL